MPPFARVIFLTGAASNQLHTAGNIVWAGVIDQKMDMVGGDHVIQYRKTEALFGLEYPVQITLPTENGKSRYRTFSGFRFLEHLEQSEAVERLEPNLVGWRAALVLLERLF